MSDTANLVGESVKRLTFLILISSSSFSAGCFCLGRDKKGEKNKNKTTKNGWFISLHQTSPDSLTKQCPNWDIGTNLGSVTSRGGYCDLNVRFPHLHLRNKWVKTFLVSSLFLERQFSFQTQLHRAGFEMLGAHAKTKMQPSTRS